MSTKLLKLVNIEISDCITIIINQFLASEIFLDKLCIIATELSALALIDRLLRQLDNKNSNQSILMNIIYNGIHMCISIQSIVTYHGLTHIEKGS